MGTAITNAFGIITEAIGEVFTMVTTPGTGDAVGMGDLFFLGIAVALAITGVTFVKRLCWGA